MKSLVPIVITALLATGCGIGETKSFVVNGEFEGWNATATNRPFRAVRLYNNEDLSVSSRDLDNNGRFDEIFIDQKIPKGHPLESYATLEKLEKAYTHVTKDKN